MKRKKKNKKKNENDAAEQWHNIGLSLIVVCSIVVVNS